MVRKPMGLLGVIAQTGRVPPDLRIKTSRDCTALPNGFRVMYSPVVSVRYPIQLSFPLARVGFGFDTNQ